MTGPAHPVAPGACRSSRRGSSGFQWTWAAVHCYSIAVLSLHVSRQPCLLLQQYCSHCPAAGEISPSYQVVDCRRSRSAWESLDSWGRCGNAKAPGMRQRQRATRMTRVTTTINMHSLCKAVCGQRIWQWLTSIAWMRVEWALLYSNLWVTTFSMTTVHNFISLISMTWQCIIRVRTKSWKYYSRVFKGPKPHFFKDIQGH